MTNINPASNMQLPNIKDLIIPKVRLNFKNESLENSIGWKLYQLLSFLESKL